MRIKIAVCDDEVKICSHLEEMLKKILKNRCMTYEIKLYYASETLCRDLEEERFNIIFLDIEFPRMSGLKVGKIIRDIKNDNITQIVYISSNQEYAMELFAVRPMDFLVKPIAEKRIEKVLDVYFKIHGIKEEYFHYKKGFSYFKIELFKIMYFSRENRKVIISATDRKDIFYGSLESVYEQVKDYGFLFIHKSYIVNYRFIKTIHYEQVVMTDDIEYPISQARRKEIRDKYQRLEGE